MVVVRINKNHSYYQMKVSGHASFDVFGKDTICAGVSCILFGGINALGKYLQGDEWFVVSDKDICITIDKLNHEVEVIMETIWIQLKTIEDSFPKNIQIIIQEVEKC